MAKLVQCVPNFSEGRRSEVVEAITDAIRRASSVRVVDYSMDPDHNRSVVTFLGAPEEVRKSMLAGARAAVDLIDMNGHAGEHPRIGAVDVIPVVPIQDVTMAEAIELSQEIGRDIAEQLRVPVHFYENSATAEHRANLADVRKGGFDALKSTDLTGSRQPDLGPSRLHRTAGAVAVGARGLLIAFNVNLATADVGAAKTIAAKIRKMRTSHESLKGVKAIGVYLGSRGIAQVSTNITRPDKVSMYDVYSFVEAEARSMGIEVLETELIGAIREKDLTDEAKSAMRFRGFKDDQVLDRWM